MFLHYLGKVNSSNLLQVLKKMQTRKFHFWTHLVLVHITYILIICFNFWFLLNFFANSRRLTTTKKEVARERLLRTWPMFSQSLMVSVGIPKLGCTDLVFVDPSVKINGVMCSCQSSYYPSCVKYREFFVFQQDNAPAHRHTVRLLEQLRRSFHWIIGQRTALTSIRLITGYGA